MEQDNARNLLSPPMPPAADGRPIDRLTLDEIIAENARRNENLRRRYDPVSGSGCCGPRRPFDCSPWGEGTVMLPVSMTESPELTPGMSRDEYRMLRFRHDFEYWCYRCVVIKDKESLRLTPFTLNRAQARLAAVLEEMRRRGLPVRLIMVKARQWGASTMVLAYTAWWQLVLHTRCNAVVVGHRKDAAATIKAMYSALLDYYPAAYIEPELEPELDR